jgi:UDP-hydrolysing UDP-N-acetyl-D-glucosamine 2-epimerase
MLASETPEGTGIGSALCTMKMVTILSELQPDVLFVIADRYESLALAQAALCCNVRIAHLEGGEVSGSIDERIRHAVTKLAHMHFPANAPAADRIVKMGEHRESIVVVGSPSFDLLSDRDHDGARRLSERLVLLADLDISKPFLLISQHPVVTEHGEAARQFQTLAEAVIQLALPVLWVWPNNDAGASAVQASLDWLRSHPGCPKLAVVSALPIEQYGAALKHAACQLGNSSSGIREAAFLGTRSVNIGNRQMSRERGSNVLDCACTVEAIVDAVDRQLANGSQPADFRYGDGTAGEKIAAQLADYWPSLDKLIAY